MKYSKCEYCGAYHTGEMIPTNCTTCGATLPEPQYVRNEDEFHDMIEAAKTAISEINNLTEPDSVKKLHAICDEIDNKTKECEIESYNKLIRNSDNLVIANQLDTFRDNDMAVIKTAKAVIFAIITIAAVALCISKLSVLATVSLAMSVTDCTLFAYFKAKHKVYANGYAKYSLSETDIIEKATANMHKYGGNLLTKKQAFDTFLSKKDIEVNDIISEDPKCKNSKWYDAYMDYRNITASTSSENVSKAIDAYFTEEENTCQKYTRTIAILSAVETVIIIALFALGTIIMAH